MSRELRTEQKDAFSTLVSGKDLLAVLPIGFGKSLIFQMLVLIKQIMTGKPSSTVVVCPIQTIIFDQLAEAFSMGLTAAALTESRLEDTESAKYQFIFASAEEVLSKPFLSSLKNEHYRLLYDNSIAPRACVVVLVEKRDFRCH